MPALAEGLVECLLHREVGASEFAVTFDELVWHGDVICRVCDASSVCVDLDTLPAQFYAMGASATYLPRETVKTLSRRSDLWGRVDDASTFGP